MKKYKCIKKFVYVSRDEIDEKTGHPLYLEGKLNQELEISSQQDVDILGEMGFIEMQNKALYGGNPRKNKLKKSD